MEMLNRVQSYLEYCSWDIEQCVWLASENKGVRNICFFFKKREKTHLVLSKYFFGIYWIILAPNLISTIL